MEGWYRVAVSAGITAVGAGNEYDGGDRPNGKIDKLKNTGQD